MSNTAYNFYGSQFAYDMAAPEPEEIKYIDTAAGSAWADSIAVDLMNHRGLKVGGREVISQSALADRFADEAGSATDPDGNYNAALLRAAMGDGEGAKACIEAFMGRKFVENLAYEIAAEYVEAYAQSWGDNT